MPIRQTFADPGTAAAATYSPFKVVSLGGHWVMVTAGEVFHDPAIGGELVDIKGLGVPFFCNPSSFIYLQLFFDLSGKVTHAGIAHTGEHLTWLIPRERWINYPRMYAIDQMYYWGMWTRNDSGGADRNDVRRAGFINMKNNAPAAPGPPPPEERGHVEEFQDAEGWFHHKRNAGENSLDDALMARWNPQGTQAANTNADFLSYPDKEKTANIAYLTNAGAGMWKENQVYTGIDRELRKEICAQGITYMGHGTPTFWGNSYPYNLKTVGWMPSDTKKYPIPNTHRRQWLGNKKATLGRRSGKYELGGYMNPGWNPNYGGFGGPQWDAFMGTYSMVQHGFLENVEKLWRTNLDQVMAFYPIAYSSLPTRNLDDGFVNGGISLKAFTGYDKAGDPHEVPAFRLVQACKTNLRLATVLEGDARFKVLVPYQGMHSQQFAKQWATGVDNFLNFDQKWDQHVCNGPDCGHIDFAAWRAGGDKYYKRRKGADLPFETNYVDALFNNQIPVTTPAPANP